MKRKLYIFALLLLLPSLPMSAQADKKEVRAGNRKFGKENYREAEIDYRKALLRDSLSFAANYNLASTQYRENDFAAAAKTLETLKRHPEQIEASVHAADMYFNEGDIAIKQKNWKAAVDAFKESLLLRPEDMQAKENYIYAKKMLENQQNQGGGGKDNKEQQDNNKEQQDNNKEQQDNNKQQQDKNKEQPQDNDKPQDKRDNREQQLSPQQAQQMLRAIQAKEKETQDKVNKEKAEALKSRQKEKNW